MALARESTVSEIFWKIFSFNKTWNIGVIDLTKIFPSYLNSRMSKERKEKVWAPKFNTAIGVALQKQNDTEKLDSSILENHLQKEAAKEEYDQLKKLGGEWSNKYFRFGLKF